MSKQSYIAILAIVCAVCGFVTALNDIDGWGWFLVVAAFLGYELVTSDDEENP